MSATHEKERTLQRQIGPEVEAAVPGVEVLAVELAGPDRFTVFIDHVNGVDHALCARVTDVLRDYRRDYAIDVSSPGLARPLRKPEHFANAVGRKVALRTPTRKKLRGEVVSVGERAVTVKAGEEPVEIPYDAIVRGNLIPDEDNTQGNTRGVGTPK
jgi:ribosome maturation factor RimP